MARRILGPFLLVTLLVSCDGSHGDDDMQAGAARSSGARASGGNAGASGSSGKQGASAAGGSAGASGRAASTGGSPNGGRSTAGQGGASPVNGGADTSGGKGGSRGGGSGAGGAGSGGGGTDSGGEAGAAGSATVELTYSTNFDTAQSPLSENGAWHHDGLDWTLVDTAAGIAYGTQALGVSRSGPTGYNDSYAYLAGFPPDQEASAVIALGTIDASCTHEVEIILRWADSAHNARGYECNVAFDGSYAQIVRWNGAVGDYTYLATGNVPGGVRDGDTVNAKVVGGHITLSVNGTERANADDATFPDGNPGVAFWRGSSGCGTFGDYGFTSFTAHALAP